MKQTVSDRFDEADVAADRFVSVRDGGKMCVDHDTRFDDPRDVPGENYGVYADEDDQLVVLDVDDHDGGDDDISRRGLVGLGGLPPTLQFVSPHTTAAYGPAGHSIYRLEGDETPAEVFKREFGKANPVPSWGEVIAKNKYAVGAGSQLDGCTKDWCDECATTDGGCYEIKGDREIATVAPDVLVDALASDPDLERERSANDDGDLSEFDAAESTTQTTSTVGTVDTVDADEFDDLDREQVEELLSALPGDQHFDDWIATGYAVYDWDGGETGKEVFTEWSRTNGDWERQESRRQIDYIWSNGESGESEANASVGTLVHKAREHGYDGDLGTGTSKPASPPEPDLLDWQTVRQAYAAEHSSTPDKYARKMASDLLLERNDYATPTDTEELYEYHEPSGVYERGGEPSVKATLREELGAHCSNSEINEIVASVTERCYIDRDEFNGGEDDRLLCVANGVLDLETRELRDHDPKHYFTRALPVDYDPDATAPAMDTFLDEITERREDKQTMLEMVGAALWPEYLKGKFMILFGEGGNGKSVFYDVVGELLGGENVSGWDLQDLGDNRFATSALVGKYANIGGDMDSVKVKNTGVLKKLTGGDQMMVEQKNENAVVFTNSATLMFGANRPPVIDEASRAVKRRLVPIRLPYEFTNDPDELGESEYVKAAKDEDELKSELTTGDELAGLLNMALDGLDRLRENGDVSLPESQDERLEYYEQFSDPIKEFAVRCLQNEQNTRVEKDSVYSAYKSFCADRDYTNRQKSTFFRQLARTTFDVNTVRAGSDGQRTRMLDSATFTDVGETYAPEYFADRDTDTDADDTADEDDTPALADLDPGRHDLTATVAEKMDPKPWQQARGHLVDGEGNIMEFVAEGSTNPVGHVEPDDRVEIASAKVATDRDGILHVEISGVCDVTVTNRDADQSALDDADTDTDTEAAADGGEDVDGIRGSILTTLRDDGDPMSIPALLGAAGVDPGPGRTAVSRLAEQGRVTVEDRDGDPVVMID